MYESRICEWSSNYKNFLEFHEITQFSLVIFPNFTSDTKRLTYLCTKYRKFATFRLGQQI